MVGQGIKQIQQALERPHAAGYGDKAAAAAAAAASAGSLTSLLPYFSRFARAPPTRTRDLPARTRAGPPLAGSASPIRSLWVLVAPPGFRRLGWRLGWDDSDGTTRMARVPPAMVTASAARW